MRLDWLRALCTSDGPFATVVVDVSHATEDAAHLADLRRRAVRDALAEGGAPESAVKLVDAALEDAPPRAGAAGRALVADERAVLVDVALPQPPRAEHVTWGGPELLPVVEAAPDPVPTVVVRLDKTGGDVFVAGHGAPEHVEGRDRPVHKVRGGGMSHLSMQERVEEAWRRNTAEVAGRVDERVRTSGARLLLIAGEEQSRAHLRDALPERSAALAVDGPENPDDLDDAVAAAMERVRRAERRAAFARYTELAGRSEGLAAAGLAAVLAAARAQAFDTLVLDPARLTTASVWAGPEPGQLAASRGELADLGVDLGVDLAVEVPAVSALIRAAACTDAALVVLDDPAVVLGHDRLDDGAGAPEEALFGGDTLPDGVGAILRFPLR